MANRLLSKTKIAAVAGRHDNLRDAIAEIAYTYSHHNEHDLRIIFGELLTDWLDEDHTYKGGG